MQMNNEQVHLKENTVRFFYIGREWQILRADMEKLWEKMAEDTLMQDNACDKHSCDKDERLPYWAELWPSSLALAKWLEINQKSIEKKNCMDLGCGLGFTALCGAYLGAFVVGVDYEADAIKLAKENAEANDFKVIDFRVMDWRVPDISKHSFDFVWAADIVYERAFAKPVLDFLEYALKDTGKAWIAEPGRAIFEHFPEMLKGTSFKMRRVSSQETEALSAGIPKAHVNIWEIARCEA